MDEQGQAQVTTVARYLRTSYHGKENVEIGTRILHTTDPSFKLLADYARELMAATGLRRSPFHLEAKIDDRGPCLIEVAARFCGSSALFRDTRMHNGCDLLGHALAHYLHDSDVPRADLDWSCYYGSYRGAASGVSSADGLIAGLRGTAEIESMSEFVGWQMQPKVGQRVRRTLDLVSSPWTVEFEAPTAEELEAACARAHEVIAWEPAAGLRDRAQAAAAYLGQKVPALTAAPASVIRTRQGWRR